MPITNEQAEVLRALRANRSAEAYLAGGLLAARDSARISTDIDFFHNTAGITMSTFARDRSLLEEMGFTIETPIKNDGFIRAIITRGDVSLKVDWAHEAAWHFFQPVENEQVGFELHWADAATNKVLAMAGRAEIRDGFDALHWHRNPLSLGALIWAASGKDAGMTPGLILEEMRRNARIQPDQLKMLQTVTPVDAQKFGVEFRQALREAEGLLQELPVETMGSLFLDDDGNIIEPDPARPETLRNPLAPSKGGLMPALAAGPDAPEPF